jgi:hypothetical protein
MTKKDGVKHYAVNTCWAKLKIIVQHCDNKNSGRESK